MRHKAIPVIAAMLLAALVWSGPLPVAAGSAFHQNLVYKILDGTNIWKVKEILGPELEGRKLYDFVVLQTFPYEITPDFAAYIRRWVEAGGTLWFHDSRLAEYFGMENRPIRADLFRHKTRNGPYATKAECPGAVTVAGPAGDHQVLTKVDGVGIFMLKVDDDGPAYSAVATGGPVIPLLTVFAPVKTAAGEILPVRTSPAAAALRPLGQGWVIFKPLVVLGQASEARFTANLKEFSAGYVVPDSQAARSAALRGVYDRVVDLSGKERFGRVETTIFGISAAGGIQQFVGKSRLKRITFQADLATLTFKDGTELTGTLLDKGLIFAPREGGPRIQLDYARLKLVEFKQ